MSTLFRNAMVYTKQGFIKKDIFVSSGRIQSSCQNSTDSVDTIIDCENKVLVPGFTDVHVHLREPGFSYKETIETGTKAAAKGGYTCVCAMPNLNPVPSNMENLQMQLDLIEKSAVVKTIPYGTITQKQDGRSELSDMKAMASYVVGFSDDGKGLQTGDLMEEAMIEAKKLDKMIVAHCEDESLLRGGYIHDGEYAQAHGHKGICSESEWKQIERDLELAKKTGVSYHVCHISTKESVDLIRKAKKEGVNVTCETGPHYLILSDADLKEEGRFKMNPPLRSNEDKLALIEGVQDGTIDMIATDHAPHSLEEKSRGLEKSAFGIVGLETCFALLYSELVLKGIISLEKLIELMSVNPTKRFNLEGGSIEENAVADLTLLDLDEKWTIDPNKFESMGKATPFENWQVQGSVLLTMVDGEIVYQNSGLKAESKA